MILDNIHFDFPTSVATQKQEFLTAFNTSTLALFAKQLKQEKLRGYSISPLYLINYWAIFALCVIIKHESTINNITSYSYYKDLYNLDVIALNLQKVEIDITKVYAIFDLFGYSN